MSGSVLVWLEVTAVAPELDGKVSVIAQDMILAITNQLLAPPRWPDDDILETARVLYAAHMATLETRRGVAGPITGRSMGEMSASFGAGPFSTSFLSTTSYGSLFLTLAKTRPFRGGFVTGLAQ